MSERYRASRDRQELAERFGQGAFGHRQVSRKKPAHHTRTHTYGGPASRLAHVGAVPARICQCRAFAIVCLVFDEASRLAW